MHYRRAPWIVGLGVAVATAGACSREARDTTATSDVTANADRAAELQRERDQDIAKLTDRVAEIERGYQQQTAERPRGTAGATPGLREEVQEDVKNVRQAVADLKTTNADNWWERHEQAMSRTADDIEADVRRMSGARELPAPRADTTAPSGEVASSAPFTSRRDRFVKQLRTRIESWDNVAGEGLRARGSRDRARRRARPRAQAGRRSGSPRQGERRRLVGCHQGAGRRLHRSRREVGRAAGRQSRQHGAGARRGAERHHPAVGSLGHQTGRAATCPSTSSRGGGAVRSPWRGMLRFSSQYATSR